MSGREVSSKSLRYFIALYDIRVKDRVFLIVRKNFLAVEYAWPTRLWSLKRHDLLTPSTRL